MFGHAVWWVWLLLHIFFYFGIFFYLEFMKEIQIFIFNLDIDINSIYGQGRHGPISKEKKVLFIRALIRHNSTSESFVNKNLHFTPEME